MPKVSVAHTFPLAPSEFHRCTELYRYIKGFICTTTCSGTLDPPFFFLTCISSWNRLALRMGVQGLRKFVDGSSCTKVLTTSASSADTTRVEHVLCDMNSIIHSCYSKNHSSPKETIQAVIERLVQLLTRVVAPTKTLTLCFDGPAPVAKLQTQRLRRRKVATLDIGNNKQFSHLAITTGSHFMIELENRLAKFLQAGGVLLQSVPIYFFGSTCIGEGEAKIASALAYHASDPLHYRTSDQVAVFGNDIDLTLTCLGATPFQNLFVVGPSSLQVIAVGDFMSRWLLPSSSFLVDVSQLPSTRIDLIFLFLLNGGDHYVGLGEVAVDVWKRYRLVRTQQPYRGIVSDDLLSIDVELLADVLQVENYTGHAEASAGSKLLRAALWSTYMTVTGVCPNFHFVCDEIAASLSNVKAAIASRFPVKLDVSPKPPLSPLATFVALMPTTDFFPDGVRSVVKKQPLLSKRLQESNDPKIIAQAATEAVELAKEQNLLSKTELFLCAFSSPVQINFVPKTKHMSRNEQHRLIAKTGSHELAPEPPRVKTIQCPENFQYQCSVYKVKDLIFRNPFVTPPTERRFAVRKGDQTGVVRHEDKDDVVGDDNELDSDLLNFLGADAATLHAPKVVAQSATLRDRKRKRAVE